MGRLRFCLEFPVFRFLFSVFCFLFLSPVASGDTYPRQPGIDIIHYVFRLSLMPGDKHDIAGETTVTVRMNAADVREVMLDLTSAASGKGMTVTAVTSDGQPLKYSHAVDRLAITLPQPAKAGDERSITVTYQGVPASGLEFINNLHGEPTIFSDNWPNHARQWLPTVDHPYDKATGELVVTTGAQYQVVSNGVLIAETDLGNGLRVTHWKQSVPIASWLYALGVARFTSHHAGSAAGVPLQTWVFPADRKTGEALFEDLSRRAMTYFHERIGPYSYEKLANVQAAGVSGGMELATAIFYGDKEVAEGRAPVVHEIAHQWFGDSVTERDWDDVWLSEGFATYFALLFTEHDEGRDAFVEGLSRSRAQVLQLDKKLPDTPIIHRNLADMKQVLNQLVYQKGGWTLHMLRFLVGDEAFWRGIRSYYGRYQNQIASTDDLRACMEQASKMDLKWFFDQWLTRPGVPQIEGEWSYDAAKKEVIIMLRQTQPSGTYRLLLELGVINPDGKMDAQKVEFDQKTKRFTIASDTAPKDVRLDPATWLLYEPGPFARAR
jgi:aminopeptidase N